MISNSRPWMIYGATGYTGRLIAESVKAAGQRPILAGRNRSKTEPLSKMLDCPFRVFGLSSVEAIADHIKGMSAVLHCAGPFSRTGRPMIEACLMAGVNYLDITGELDMIEFAAGQHERAVAAGISIMPAVGFDVVPTDCLAVQLAESLPNATDLALAFRTGAGVSPGTAKAIFATSGDGGRVRLNGRITRVPTAWKTMRLQFPTCTRDVATVPWGDVASAFYSTRIPNIRVYASMKPGQAGRLRRWRWLLPGMKFAPVQWIGQRLIERFVKGPNELKRTTGIAEFWGRATDDEGRVAEATLVTPEGYSLTAQTATEIMRRTLAGGVAPGFSTPAQAFGGNFIEQFDKVQLHWRTNPSEVRSCVASLQP